MEAPSHGRIEPLSTEPEQRQCSCGAPLLRTVVDFGDLPISNALVLPQDLDQADKRYPLHIMVCEACTLAQLADKLPADAHFHSDYVYFSSHSTSWLAHCEAYVSSIIERLDLQVSDEILEIASNDGYLLQYFKAKGFAVQGVEPSASVADAAIAKGIPTVIDFFGKALADRLAADGRRPKLIVANNVIAHVPDLEDFTAGISTLMGSETVLTAEVHYFRNLFEKNQFDSFYHEHYYYYTIEAAHQLMARHGMRLFDAELLPTHGGSLRLYACHADAPHELSDRLTALLASERAFMVTAMAGIDEFQVRIQQVCDDLLTYLTAAKASGRRVLGYGAPAKATTMLNVAGVTPDLLPIIVDMNPSKQNRYLPGVRIPIQSPEILAKETFDDVAILPWNLRDEISDLCRERYNFEGKFVVFVPALEVF